MPPKRRGPQSKAQPTKPAPDPPKPPHPQKQPPPAPPPMPSPPLLQVESDAARVRREWSKFVDAWYEPHKKKLVEKLQKELLVKYKNIGSPKETQKLREMELFEKSDAIAQQLAQPARTEWERRLELAHLREDQWDDMSAEEQQAVMGVFVGFFDDVEDMDQNDDFSPNLEEDNIIEEPQHRPIPSPPSRQAIPPTPTRANFEFVNPTSFFVDTSTPPNPMRNLPALPMDHLATLGPSNSARSADPVGGGVGGTFGFQNWASEVGIVSQQPSLKHPPPAQTLARPRATDNMSRQASAASNLSSPLSKTTSPQYSPPNPTTKFSPPINPDSLPLGKRYIGPIIVEEEADPLDEELLKSKMADDYQQFKVGLRIQMIYQFHAEAADIEIRLFESLLTAQGTKESRARAVQEHETSMMRLREQKEEDRKRLCAEEREKRRQEMRQHLAQRRPQNHEVEPKLLVPPASVQPRPGKVTRQKENVPLAAPPAKLDPPSILKKSSSMLSQEEATANEMLFANVQQRPTKVTGHQKENVPLVPPAKLELPSAIKKSSSILSQDEAVANEALFANALSMMHGKSATGLTPTQASLNEAVFANAAAMLAAQESSGKPSAMNKPSNRLQEDVPMITVSLAEAPAPVPAAQTPHVTAKGKKGKRGPGAVAKIVTVTEEPETDAAPAGPSLWDTAAGVSKSAWGATASIPKPVEVDPPAPSKPSKKPPAPSSSKKGKKVTVTEEPDVDAPALPAAPPPPKSAWGAVNKARAAPAEEQVMSAWSKKPHLKVSISEETGTSRSAWPGPSMTPVRVEPEPEPEEASLAATGDAAETEPCASDWFNPETKSYWANVMADGTHEPELEPELAGKHVRWTPTVNESDDEGEGEESLETNLWMQYAISGGNIPSLAEEQKTSDATFFDRAVLPGQWPKMEWMPRGQSSGSAHVF